MEVMGLFALIIILCYSSYPNKVKKLEREMRKVKKLSGGTSEMSKIINELIGKYCIITRSSGITMVEKTLVLDADDDWVKIEKTNKKNVKSIEIMRIDGIEKIDLIIE